MATQPTQPWPIPRPVLVPAPFGAPFGAAFASGSNRVFAQVGGFSERIGAGTPLRRSSSGPPRGGFSPPLRLPPRPPEEETGARERQRISRGFLYELSSALSERDWQIIETIDLLNIVTGHQIQRLHFWQLADGAQNSVRKRTLRRLTAVRAVRPLGRRVGGFRHGSDPQVYGLGPTGARLLRQREATTGYRRAYRRYTPGEHHLGHLLTVSELYVRLTEAARANELGAELTAFATEPACWWRHGATVWLKPDAHLLLTGPGYLHHWWVEVDRGTRHLPNLVRQLRRYLDFAAAGHTGPDGVMPRVLVTVPTDARRAALSRALSDLPAPAGRLFTVACFDHATTALAARVRAAETRNATGNQHTETPD